MTIHPVCQLFGGGLWDGHAFWYADDMGEKDAINTRRDVAMTHTKTFAYYISLPAVDSGVPLPQVLATQRALPIFNLLIKNIADEQAREALQKQVLKSSQLIPFTASPLTAMTLAFFAFRPEIENGMLSKSMHLRTYRTSELLEGCPPTQHPLCSFWTGSSANVCDAVKSGASSLHTQFWRMTVNQTKDFKAYDEMVQKTSVMLLREHKRRLTLEEEDLMASLEMTKKLKADVEAKLTGLVEKNRQSPEKDSEKGSASNATA